MIIALGIYLVCCIPLLVWLIRGSLELKKRNTKSCINFFKAFIYSSGLTIMGYGILDDIFLFIFYLSLLNSKSQNLFLSNKRKPIYTLLYAALMLFLMLNSLRTILLLDDFRAIRFAFLFSLLFLISISNRFSYFLYENSDGNDIIKLFFVPVAYLYSAYFISESSLYLIGFEKFQFQNIYWPSSSTMFSITILLFPILAFVLTRNVYINLNKNSKKIVFYLLLVVSVNAFFYDSRLAQLLCISTLVVMVFSNFLKGIIVFLILTLIIFITYSGEILHFADALFTSATGRQESDLDRILQPMAAYNSIIDNSSVWVNLFGFGYYAERIFVIDYISQIYVKYGLDGFKSTFIRMPSAPAFFAGNGIIGVALFCSTLTAYILSLLNLATHLIIKIQIIFLTTVLYVISYFTSINYELVLLYLIISPNFVWIVLSNRSFKSYK